MWSTLCFLLPQSNSTRDSPLSPGIHYEIDTPPRGYWDNQEFMGEPNRESDKAWNDLLHPHGLRVFADEAARLDITESVSLPNGDFATITGFDHNLHCLRRLRQTIHESYYYPNITAEQRESNKEHNGMVPFFCFRCKNWQVEAHLA
ncbi:MAG: hypothetical protein Q9187_000653 [Circinaria calcarea]